MPKPPFQKNIIGTINPLLERDMLVYSIPKGISPKINVA